MQLLRKIAFPISLLYGLVVYFRNYLYDVGVFKSKKFATPTICIGNLSVGGTGKTPMTEFLISNLMDAYKLAILSRGYGRKSSGYLLANENSTVEELGDEPYQIYSKYANISVAVDANRVNGITILEDTIKPQVILLDDAFQHRKVNASLNILLTSYTQLYCDDWYLPTGDLRDSKKQAKRAAIVIITKCPKTIAESKIQEIATKLKLKKHQSLVFSYLAYEEKLKGLDGEQELTTAAKQNITLVTGIANPNPFTEHLKSKGLVFNHLKYKDHHFFAEKEIALFNTKELVICTEKDYVRLKGRVKNLWYLGVRHQFIADGKENVLKHVTKLLS